MQASLEERPRQTSAKSPLLQQAASAKLSLSSRATVGGFTTTLPELQPRFAQNPKETCMKLYTYLNYGGNCRQAFEFYAEHLGGKITFLTTHGEQPDSSQVPPEWGNAVLHARIEMGDTTVLGADIPPDRFQPMRSAYLSLLVDSIYEAERIYALLSEGGQIFMPMEETFFAHRFGMLRDRFATSWMLQHERGMA
jgi:PhnB protein